MANPLAILSSLIGGLTTTGAQGAQGAFQGTIEGQGLRQKMDAEQQAMAARQRLLQSQDIEDQLKLLKMVGQQRAMNQPSLIPIGGGHVIVQYPDGRWSLERAPQPPPAPLSEVDQATAEYRRAQAEKLRAEIPTLGQPKPKEPPHLSAETQLAYDAWRARPENQGKDFLAFQESQKLLGREPPRPQPGPASLDALLAKAHDPTVDPAERARAKQQADAIIAAREQIARASAESRQEVKTAAQEEKDRKSLAGTETLLNQLESLLPDMEQKGFLARNASMAEYNRARAKRSALIPFYGEPADPTLVAWKLHEGTMVRILRDLGDIGPRAIAAFESAINVLKNPTTRAGAQLAFDQLREAVRSQRSGVVGGLTLPEPKPPRSVPVPKQGQVFPALPNPATMPGRLIEDVKTGERFRSDGVKWDRVGGGQAPHSPSSGGPRATKRFNPQTGRLEDIP